MKVKVLVTQEELKLMGISEEQLGQIVLEQLDDTDVKGMRICHQTELEVETILESEVEQKWSQYIYPSLMKNNLKEE